MASLGETFELSKMDQPSNSFEPLPVGWYDATITKAEIKVTKSGTGKYISIRFDITGPTHQGRVVFTNINIRNEKPGAEKRGREDFAAIMLAGGIPTATDSDHLIGASMRIDLGIERSEGYADKNSIKAYKALSGGIPAAAAATKTAAKGSSGPSWATK